MKIAKENMLKKLLASLLAALVLFVSIAPTTAQAVWYNQNFAQFWTTVYDTSTPPQEIFGERYTAAQVDWIIKSLIAWPFVQVDPSIVVCLGSIAPPPLGAGNATPCIGMIDAITNLFTGLLTYGDSQPQTSLLAKVFKDRPLSGKTYIKQKLARLNPVIKVNAQTTPDGGFGYKTALGGLIQELWAGSRNAAYGLFIFMAIILSFMIMFRVKLNPQTVITIQSSIPKLFITLILITFSYAIAGFLIDLMYVAIGLIVLIFENSIPNDLTNLMGEGMFELLTEGFLGTGIFGFMVFYLLVYTMITPFTLITIVGKVLNLIAGALLFTGLGWLPIIIAGVVFFILVLVIYAKTIFTLLKAYANIILLVIFGPFQIAIGMVVPGMGFGSWLKNLAANLAVFPVVGLLLTLSYMFLTIAVSATINELTQGGSGALGITGTPVNIGQGWPPLLGAGGSPGPIVLLGISLIFLFMIPNAANIVKGAIAGNLSAGSAIGEPLAFMGLGASAMALGKSQAGRMIFTGASPLPQSVSRAAGRIRPYIPGRFGSLGNRGIGEETRQSIGEGLGYRPPSRPTRS